MNAHAIVEFAGARALGEFRLAQLLPRLQAVHPRIQQVTAQFVHLVWTAQPLDAPTQARVAELLTYGEPFQSATATSAAGAWECPPCR